MYDTQVAVHGLKWYQCRALSVSDVKITEQS